MASIVRFGLCWIIFFSPFAARVFAENPAENPAEYPAEDPPAAVAQLPVTVLDNGVRLLVVPQPEEPFVQTDIYLSLRGATQNEGLAHLIEHLMFRSSENCPSGSLSDSLQLLATYSQGLTNTRNIHTTSRCLPHLLPRLLAVEADRYGRLRPDADDLKHEKLRVLGEGDFRKEVYTAVALNLRIIAMAYENGRQSDSLLGSAEAIKAVGLADVDTFLTQRFRPERMVILVSGPVDLESTREAVTATFGQLSATGEPPVVKDLPQRPDSTSCVIHTNDSYDLLTVGFRLPYATPEETAMAHLTETIMASERHNPSLYIFEDEALLILQLMGDWSDLWSDHLVVSKATEQFWDDMRTVKNRVRESWHFERNRKARAEDLRDRMNQPYLRATWQAQRLADDRILPDPEVMAAMIDTLAQGKLDAFLAEQLLPSRAYSAFAIGKAKDDDYMAYWHRNKNLRINPYLVRSLNSEGLSAAHIAPILAAAETLQVGRAEQLVLPNGIPVHIMNHPKAKKVYLGGVRSFPWLEDEAPSRQPGRLLLYQVMANAGYSRKGSAVAPTGDNLGWNTGLVARADGVSIWAYGSGKRFKRIAAAMHKRIKVDKMNPYVFRLAVDSHDDWVTPYREFPTTQSHAWRLEHILGPDHPLLGFYRPDAEYMAKSSTGKANKMHRKIWRTGNLQLVITGDVDIKNVEQIFAPTFSKLRDAEPGYFPLESSLAPGIDGGVVHSAESTFAVSDFTFPPQPLAAEPPLGPVDLTVLERVMETRLHLAALAADLDSVSISCDFMPAGMSALPFISVISRPADAAQILTLVQAEAARLASEPVTVDEEARAALQLLEPFCETWADAGRSHSLMLYWGQFGDIPDAPLAALCGRRLGSLGVRAPGFFPPDHYGWTVIGDKSLPSIRNLGPILHHNMEVSR